MLLFRKYLLPKIFSQESDSSVHSVTQSCPTLCNPMNCSMPGLPVHHQLNGHEFEQTPGDTEG